MTKKTDKIDRLLLAYKKTSTVRIAAERRRDARLDAIENAREKFIEDTKKKIIFTVRPAMKRLLGRLGKKDFRVSIIKEDNEQCFLDCYYIKGIAEKGMELFFTLGMHEEQNKVAFRRSYCFSDNDASNIEYEKLYRLNEINEQLIKKLFIAGLQKICISKK